jgi:hypothetical protein
MNNLTRVRFSPFTVISKQAHSTEGRSKRHTCSCELLNALGKGSLLHSVRPIKTARASPAVFLRPTDDEKVVLRAPQKRAQPLRTLLGEKEPAMFYVGIGRADQKHDALVIDEAGHQAGSIRVPHTAEGLYSKPHRRQGASNLCARRCMPLRGLAPDKSPGPEPLSMLSPLFSQFLLMGF